MKQTIRALLGSIITLCAILPAAAEIKETKEISKALDYATEDSLILFNITGTLYQPSNTLADHQWREYFSKRVEQIVPDPKISQALIDQTKNLIVQKIPKKTVEDVTPQMVASLQAKKIPVLGLTKKQASTSYADNFAWITQKHLADLGIHLEKTLSYLKFKDGNAKEQGYTFAYGILFTNKQAEGPALNLFLNTLEQKPSVIIAVDNTLSSLENMQHALETQGIKFMGLRYGRADEDKANFDPVLGTVEFLTFINEGRIITDAEASALKQSTPSVNYDALLDYYIHKHSNQ